MREKSKGRIVEGAAYANGKGGYIPFKVERGTKPNGWRASAAAKAVKKGGK